MVLAMAPADVRLEMGEGLALQLELELSERSARVAREELREDEEKTQTAIAELKRLLSEESGLIVPLDDAFLKAALRPCHWYPEEAAQKLRNYFRFKTKYPQIGRNLLPSRMHHVAKANIILILPRRDQFGRRIVLLRTGKHWEPRKVPVDDLLRGAMMWLEIALSEPDTQVGGCVLMWDVEGLSMSQVMRFSPSFAKMLLHFLQDCIPIRVKAVHFVKQSNIFDIAFNVFKPFIRDKLRRRIYFHGRDVESLAKHVDLEAVPTDYGGRMPMRLPSPDEMIQCCEKFENYFVELSKYGYTKNTK